MKLRDYQIEARDAVLGSTIGQVISPTGTGKSVIQGAVFEELIKNSMVDGNPGFGIYVILTPRILLTNQLMKSVVLHLTKSTNSLAALTIHSADQTDFIDEESSFDEKLLYGNVQKGSTTNKDKIKMEVLDAKYYNQPLLICCTYDSVSVLALVLKEIGIKATQVLCDEAHYIVERDFNLKISVLKDVVERIHFFTATQKITKGNDGNGMNNEDFYGPVIFRKTPKEMISLGVMVRPRIHYVSTDEKASWPTMVKESFLEHQKLITKNELSFDYNAKMLVCCNGSMTIKEIMGDVGFNDWCKEEGITVFSVSSATGSCIDNKDVGRNVFLDLLGKHTGKAIILHINILTEGIDVPDISGVMFIRNMGMTKFLQSLGRASRILPQDKNKQHLTGNFVQNSLQWRKPYAWAILAERKDDNEGKTSDIKAMINLMREAGFKPEEEVVIASDRTKALVEEYDLSNMPKDKFNSTFNKLFDVVHEIEIEKLAALSDEEKFLIVV